MSKDLTMPVVLKQSAMAFQLKDGTVLLISREDVNSIANSIVTEMVCHCPERLFLPRNINESRVNMLYKVFQEQKELMPAELKQSYLKLILELEKTPDLGVETLKEAMTNQNKR